MRIFSDLFRIRKDKKFFLRAMVFCSLLAALGIVSELLGITIPWSGVTNDKINIGMSFIILSGFLFGPIWGALTALVQDFIGCFLRGEAYLPIFMMAPFLTGFLSGCFPFVFKKASKKLYGIALYCTFISAVSFFLNTTCIVIEFYNSNFDTFWVYAVPRLITQPVKIVLYTAVVFILYCIVLPRIEKTKFAPDSDSEKRWKNY